MENNKKIREEVLESVINLTDQQLNTQVNEGQWSIMQILEHLYLIERAIVKGITVALTSKSEPTPDKPIELVLNRTSKITAPSFFVPSLDFITLEKMKERLSESRQSLVQLVSKIDEEDLENKSFPHPVFGRLSLKQWIPLVGLHEKRHLEQIEEVKERLLKS